MPDVTVSVSVSGVPASLAVGQTAQAVARIATDVPDSALDSQPVVWSSSAPAVASVSASGFVKAVAVGSAQVRATVGAVVGSAPLAVSMVSVALSGSDFAKIKALPVGSQFLGVNQANPAETFTFQVNA